MSNFVLSRTTAAPHRTAGSAEAGARLWIGSLVTVLLVQVALVWTVAGGGPTPLPVTPPPMETTAIELSPLLAPRAPPAVLMPPEPAPPVPAPSIPKPEALPPTPRVAHLSQAWTAPPRDAAKEESLNAPARPWRATADEVEAASPSLDPARGDRWRGILLARLKRAKQYPAAARDDREDGVAILRFTVDRQGRLLSASVQQSTGYAILDQEVVALTYRAQPFPPPPATVAGTTITLTADVSFSLESSE